MEKFKRLLKLPLPTALTLLDQMIVSGSNFLTGILLTRWLGLEAYGVFALAWLGLMLMSSVQQAFLLTPMMSLGPKKDGAERQAYYRGSLLLQLGFLLLIGTVSCVIVWFADQWFPEWGIGFLFPVLPLAIVGFLMQEYYRRFFFILLQPVLALIVDGIAYLGLILGIVSLYLFDSLSVEYSYVLVLTTFGLSSLVGELLAKRLRRGMISSTSISMWVSAKSVFVEHWHVASWLIGKAFLQFFSSNYYILAAGVILGPSAIGALRIAQNLLGTTHVLFLAMENAVPVKASIALSRDGLRGMIQYLKLISLKAGILVGGILILLALFAEPLIELVYGTEFVEYSYLLIAYCVFYLFLFPGYPLRFALRTLESTQPIFWAYVASTIVSLLSANYLVENWGLMGVVYGLIMTTILMQMCYGVGVKIQMNKYIDAQQTFAS
ncbi:MAG: hypothetical protein AAF587_07380 [Bacteroidota bacterium]